jgi:hypothetical protein
MTTELTGATRAGFRTTAEVERMKGFAVLGVTFESGHTLALRQFEATSFGPGFTAVWMREPNGDWRFFSDNDPRQSCAKYMLPDVADQVPVDVRWVDDRTLHVSIKAISFRWFIEFEETRRTRWMSATVSRAPRWAMRSAPVSRLIATVGSKGLGLGRLRLRGYVPNGQRFTGMPRRIWQVRSSAAWAGSYNFGEVVHKAPQRRFGDFWVPAAPIAMAGEVEFVTPSRVEVGSLSLAA